MEAPTLLIIDDDEALRKSLSDILKFKGYRTLGAGNGAEGLALFNGHTVDLVLIDPNLPDLSGLEVIGRVRQRSPHTQTIVLTGHATLETSIEATNRGAFSYLRKPCDTNELLVQIRLALDKKQSEETIVRLASFPDMDPNPTVEIDGSGEITYQNPAAKRLFPDLSAAGRLHPLLDAIEQTIAVPGNNDQYGRSMREVKIGDATYLQYLSRISGGNLVRMYVIDITKRKQTEEALKQQLDEVERLNRLMVGRELKMEEMRRKIRELEASLEAARKERS